MTIESPKTVIHKSQEELFNFLTDVKNFEKLMPDNISKFEALEDNRFLFALSGMPEIVLQLKDKTEYSKIVLGAAGGKIPFSLTANIQELEPGKSEANLLFEGDFNPMMAMMVKGPITKFINTLTEKMSDL